MNWSHVTGPLRADSCPQCSNYMEARVCRAPSLIFATQWRQCCCGILVYRGPHTYFSVIRLMVVLVFCCLLLVCISADMSHSENVLNCYNCCSYDLLEHIQGWSAAVSQPTRSFLVACMPGWFGGVTVRTSDLQSSGRGFNSGSDRYQVTTLGKLFTSMCFCHQAV